MLTLTILTLSILLGIAYALVALREEERRQEWRRTSRAAWNKG